MKRMLRITYCFWYCFFGHLLLEGCVRLLLRAVKAAGWLAFVTEDTPLVVHELPPYERSTV